MSRAEYNMEELNNHFSIILKTDVVDTQSSLCRMCRVPSHSTIIFNECNEFELSAANEFELSAANEFELSAVTNVARGLLPSSRSA